MKFSTRKLESWGYTKWWRNHDASFLRFDTIPARDRQTDRRTDRQTGCDHYYPRDAMLARVKIR